MSDTPDLEPTPDETGEPDLPDGWEWVDVSAAEITLTNTETGEPVGVVTIPYDPESPPTEAEIIADAQRFWARLEYTRSIVKQEAVDDLAENLKRSAGPELFAALAEPFDALRIKIGRAGERESGPGVFSYHIDDETIDPGELEERVNELFRLGAPGLIEEIADAPIFGDRGESFWHYWAREAIAHTLATLSEIVAGELGPDASDEAHERRVLDLYEDRFLLSQEVTTHGDSALEVLTDAVSEFLKQQTEEAESGDPSNIFGSVVDAAVKTLRGPLIDDPDRPSIREAVDADKAAAIQNALTPIPAQRPAFVDDFARVGSDFLEMGVRRMVDRNLWAKGSDGRPEFHFRNDAGQAIYAPSPDFYETAEAAWEVIGRLDDAVIDLFDYTLAKIWANKGSGPLASVEVPIIPQEVLTVRGIKKQEAEEIEAIGRGLFDLAHIDVIASKTGYATEAGGKRSKKTAQLDSGRPLLDITGWQQLTIDGKRVGKGWLVSLGRWATVWDEFDPPRYAQMMRGILRLHAKNDKNAKRIGRYLALYQYPIRARHGTWKQPYSVRKLLNEAGVPIDAKNPTRFSGRIEEALDVLANPVSMDGPVCVKSWRYLDTVDVSKRGGFKLWLDARIEILPPDEITNPETGRYSSFAKGKKAARGRTRKLEPGNPKVS